MILDDWKLILITLAVGALLAAVFTWIEIPVLKKKQFGQYIRDEGPKSHQAKSGTPTMGGLALYGAVTVAALITPLYTKVRESDVFVMVAAGLLFVTPSVASDAAALLLIVGERALSRAALRPAAA